jgi:heavy metal translocating P-type ATPase
LGKLARGQFSSDLLAGISIVAAALLGEYLAGCMVILMLSGGEALEAMAVRNASSVLEALAKRAPAIAHQKHDGILVDVPLAEVQVGDRLVVLPHEICPVDGTVVEGHGSMDESYLTGEPYIISKAPGSAVLSGAINSDAMLTIATERIAADSRYARIMRVMRDAEQRRPRIRRLADSLGAAFTPLALAVAIVAGIASHDATRFLAVLVAATPCPLLIAIPVAIIGSISLAARRGIIVKDPAVLESIGRCRTAIFDKTGTLTHGKPELTEIIPFGEWKADDVLKMAASVECYSKHPLSVAILAAAAAKELKLLTVEEISEKAGEGLTARLAGKKITITNRKKLLAACPESAAALAPPGGGMESIVLIDGKLAASLRFRDLPRPEGPYFVAHLRPRHQFSRVMLVSGDRSSEVKYLADQVGISEIYAEQAPEQKLALIRRETQLAPTLFLGDGINDAPGLTAATVGIAFGQSSDVLTESAGAVILEPTLGKVDELLHIGSRMRRIALQSAIGGIALSLIAMGFAAGGYLTPVWGAVTQEVIDVLAVFNALRAATPSDKLTDY